ncbi:hypothetical protein FRC07_008872 [Ceratobasidium sp. 392]|nr:hypothetical protein FRC07_008872 [Ceratobasidium sp. 392]
MTTKNKDIHHTVDTTNRSDIDTPTADTRLIPAPANLNKMTVLNDYDSGNDTELEDFSSNPHDSFAAFKSLLSYHTAASSLNASPIQLDDSPFPPVMSSLSAPSLRRSISADRITMRPTPPPLLRTQSEGPQLLGTTSPSAPAFQNQSFSVSTSTLPGVSVSGSDDVSNVNAALNQFCGDHVYISQPNGPIYASTGGETTPIEHIGALSEQPIPEPEIPRLTAAQKGKGRANHPPNSEYDSDAYLSAISDAEPSTNPSPCRPRAFHFGSSDDTDAKVGYETISDYISDSEDIDISPYISTTTSMPPFPQPTVSRSRSSSRSFPAAPFFTGDPDAPPVPPIPAHALLGNQSRSQSSPGLTTGPTSPDHRSLQTPTPTQHPPPTPSSTSTTSLSSSTQNPRLKPPSISSSRQRSVSESNGGGSVSGSGSGSNTRSRFSRFAQALRKSPSVSPGRGIEHIVSVPTTTSSRKSKTRPKYTFAFVGSAGCGKTSIITNASHGANPKLKQETKQRWVRFGEEEIIVELRDVATIVDKTKNTSPVSTVEIESAPLLDALDRGEEIWPDTLPHIDAVVLCYNASREGNESGSFDGIQRLNDAFAARRYPLIWVGCKSDWIRPSFKEDGTPASPRILPDGIVPPNEVFIDALASHTGLIEVSELSAYGIEQMQNSFTWMYKSTARNQRDQEHANTGSGYLNQASPEVLDRRPSRRSSRSRARSTAQPNPPARPMPPPPPPEPAASTSPLLDTPISPTHLQPDSRPIITRARSMSDLLSQEARDRVAEPSAAVVRKASATLAAVQLSKSTEESRDNRPTLEAESLGGDTAGARPSEHNLSVLVLPPKFRQDKFAFMTLEDMVARLSGGMVPGLDIPFNHNFMMTFRRFSTPREILLGMIRRLRSIAEDEQETRRSILIIFDYLLDWTSKYPRDFGSPGAIDPLKVLIRDRYSHEGAPRLEARIEHLLTLTDDATDWAKPETEFTEGDDSDSENTESCPHSTELNHVSPLASVKVSVSTSVAVTPAPEPPSEPVAGPSSSSGLRPLSSFLRRGSADPSPRLTIPEQDERELRRIARALLNMNPLHVAEEITREDVSIFLALEPRDWLRHGYTTRQDRDPAVHPLDRASFQFERLGLLVASLVLALPKVRHRAFVFEFWILVASYIRGFNNFAALHTIIAAMDKVYAGSDGADIKRYVQAGEVNWKRFLSMRVLILKSNGSAYKTALKHTSLPLIPTMAIHTSDMVRVMSNRDSKEGNPKLIHWGKFQIIARIANEMVELQARIHRTADYNFQPHPEIAQVLREIKPMPEEVIDERTYPPPEEPPPPTASSIWTARVIRTVLT